MVWFCVSLGLCVGIKVVLVVFLSRESRCLFHLLDRFPLFAEEGTKQKQKQKKCSTQNPRIFSGPLDSLVLEKKVFLFLFVSEFGARSD